MAHPNEALCSRCGRRKAKRRCPALGRPLCSLCCGRARDKEIRCPNSCPFWAKHKTYQDRRTIERSESGPRSRPDSEDILLDERLAWLAAHIEFPLRVFGKGDPRLTDAAVVLALEYARDEVERSGHLLIVPGESLKPRNELGDAVLQSIENCRYEGGLIIPGAGAAYSLADRARVLDRVLLSAREEARANPQGRRFIERLIEHFARMEERTSGKGAKSSD